MSPLPPNALKRPVLLVYFCLYIHIALLQALFTSVDLLKSPVAQRIDGMTRHQWYILENGLLVIIILPHLAQLNHCPD